MSTQVIHINKKLKATLFSLPKGMPVTTNYLERLGISRQLVHRYVQSGWLESLGAGYYLRAGDALSREGCVWSLQNQGVAVHVGGKSALSLLGLVHYVALGQEKLTLYGVTGKRIPEWFHTRFPCDVHMNQLFGKEGAPGQRKQVRRLDEADAFSPLASEPERALLEMLDDVPHKQSLDEARKIMEPLFTLRAQPLQTLLEVCSRIKVKRLFFALAKELELPVLKQLDLLRMDFGADSVYIRTVKGNSLILENPRKPQHG